MTEANTKRKARPSLTAVLSGKKSNSGIGIEVDLQNISFDSGQPRKVFSSIELEDLAASIKEVGLIQPIVLRANPAKSGHFIIVAGERRYRASKLAGLTKVHAVTKEVDGFKLRLIQIAENSQNQDLTPAEYVASVGELSEVYNLTSKAIGEAIGRSKARVSEYLTVFKSPALFKELLNDGVKFRPVVELVRLHGQDEEFVLSHLENIAAKDINAKFVESLKSQLEQDNAEDSNQSNAEDSNQSNTEDSNQSNTEDSNQSNAEDSNQANTEDSNQANTEDSNQSNAEDSNQANTEDLDQSKNLYGESTIDGHTNLDLASSFQKRPASQVNVRIKYQDITGTLAVVYKPADPSTLPLEVDDGTIICVPINDCQVIGYE